MNIKRKSEKLWQVLALLIGSLVLVALVGQIVSAQSVDPELKLPFHFAESPALPEGETLPPGSTVLMTETFGASFNPVTTLTGTVPLWRIILNHLVNR